MTDTDRIARLLSSLTEDEALEALEEAKARRVARRVRENLHRSAA